MIRLEFDRGTLELSGLTAAELPSAAAPWFRPDPRTGTLRARGCDYAAAVAGLQLGRVEFEDAVRAFAPLPELRLRTPVEPRPHQQTALTAWKAAGCRGVAALPTGAGKTILAILAIAYLQRPALILVPTIDLLTQWCSVLEKYFGVRIGMLGGGSREVTGLTVSTYDSARLNLEFIGNRFGLLIADECHHLPGPENRTAAAMCIAPWRLGLSATPELPPDRAEVLADLIGDTVCDIPIDELEGKVLSPYITRRIYVRLDPEEAAEYARHRTIYTGFLRRHGITFRSAADWGRFVGLTARQPGGHEVFQSFLAQRRIARGGEAKFRKLWELITAHRDDRIIVFTADNATAYAIGRRFGLPVLTHLTRVAERKAFLDRFREGIYRILVTGQVLNEGVDVPAAAVGIVLSGSGSVREHVQRLGRILRPAGGKTCALLYEIVSAGTGEQGVSDRRRDHRAYRRHPGGGSRC